MTLWQHTNTVTSLLCWDQFLLSSSLDGTRKVWACLENGSLKVTSTRRQALSVHALYGMHDAEGKPIMFCSYQNRSVILKKEERISRRTRSRQSQFGPESLLFSGDKSGKLRVWNSAATKV
ncbi:unnamed protein product [Thlaspi arvense]|uniref:Uncharacterized protein n=1 Tax=Thlaspi arvense TaxID=13288 RepID=A0AAU9T9Y3_THLAR|nr:unnamed protein product [Thlaspi arvense]